MKSFLPNLPVLIPNIAERFNKREKIDFKLESGRHRSTKMWYCRLYHILMLQHLDAWDLPFESTLKKLILEVA